MWSTVYRDREGDRHGRHDCYKIHRLTVTEIRVGLAGNGGIVARGTSSQRRGFVSTSTGTSTETSTTTRSFGATTGPLPPTGCRTYVCVRVCMYVSSATRFNLASQSHRRDKTRVLRTYNFRGDVAAWKMMFSRLLVRPIPMRKANPAFCDRSKSHKKLDPFDDRKMVHWLAENPFLVRSSTISVRVPMTVRDACVRH